MSAGGKCLKRERKAEKENAEENESCKAVQRKCQPKAQPLLGGSLSLYVRRFGSFIINIHMYIHRERYT